MGRGKVYKDRTAVKTDRVSVRLTASDYAHLSAVAEIRNMNLSALLRAAMITIVNEGSANRTPAQR